MGAKRLIAGNSRRTISKVVSTLSQVFLNITPRIEQELLKNKENKKNRRDDMKIEDVAIAERLREKTIVAKIKGKGNRKRRENVPSARRLAIKNCLGVTGEVKTKLCSYSNAVIPL